MQERGGKRGTSETETDRGNHRTRRALELRKAEPVSTAQAHTRKDTEEIGGVQVITTTRVDVQYVGPAREVGKLMAEQAVKWADEDEG